jgi:two-component system nitrogen regulation sensor histidine kinase GlnL
LLRKASETAKLTRCFLNPGELLAVFEQAKQHMFADKRLDLSLERSAKDVLHVRAIVTSLDDPATPVLIELHQNEQQLKLDQEERMLDQNRANKELIRNLAHEIKNPLGGIRGAAQLLELELPERQLRGAEYTQVIIKEPTDCKHLSTGYWHLIAYPT